MSTRDVTFTADERQLLLKLADGEWQILDEKRMLASDRLAATYLAEQQAIELIQEKLR